MTEARIKTLRWRAAVMLEYGFLEGRDWLEMLDEIERLQKQVHGYDSIVATIADVVHEKSPLLRRFEEYEERKP